MRREELPSAFLAEMEKLLGRSIRPILRALNSRRHQGSA